MRTKLCAGKGGCGKELPITEYHVNNVRSNGSIKYRPICKTCYRASMRKTNKVRREVQIVHLFERTLLDEIFAPYPTYTGIERRVEERHPVGEGMHPDNGRHHLQSVYASSGWNYD